MSAAIGHDPGPPPPGPTLDAAELVSTDELLGWVRALQDEVWRGVQAAREAGDYLGADAARRAALLAAEMLVDHIGHLDARLAAGDPLPRQWRRVQARSGPTR